MAAALGRDVQDFVIEVRARHGATVVLTTHDMVEADRLCDRLAVIDRGRIVALDTPAGLKTRCGTDSLEEVFMQLTGRSLDDEDIEEERDGSDRA